MNVSLMSVVVSLWQAMCGNVFARCDPVEGWKGHCLCVQGCHHDTTRAIIHSSLKIINLNIFNEWQIIISFSLTFVSHLCYIQ